MSYITEKDLQTCPELTKIETLIVTATETDIANYPGPIYSWNRMLGGDYVVKAQTYKLYDICRDPKITIHKFGNMNFHS